jgi:hypothetical protein
MYCYELLIDSDDKVLDYRLVENYDRSNFEEATPLLLEKRIPGRVIREIPVDTEGNILSCVKGVESLPSDKIFTINQASSIEVLDPKLIEVINVHYMYNIEQKRDSITKELIWPDWGLCILQEQEIPLNTLIEFKEGIWGINYFGMYMKKE